MKVIAIAAALLTPGSAAHAGGKVRIYINANSAPIGAVAMAQGVSTRMLATAGVSLEWRVGVLGWHPAPGRIIVIDFDSNLPAGVRPNALAYALAFERVHIVVLYDRIKRLSHDDLVLHRAILAHVLSHEIAHVLQGLDRHSATGVMKARWDIGDYLDMMRGPLPFTAEDIDLIHRGCGLYSSQDAR